MSDVQQGSQTSEDLGWVLKNWARVRLGHEAMMLDKIDRQNRIVEQLAQNQMTGDSKNIDLWPPKEDEGDMGVNIGDTINYHTTPTATSTFAKAIPYVISAAALLGGGGLGGAALAKYLSQPVVNQVTGTDTDTQYELHISSGE